MSVTISVISEADQHFLVAADEPFRIEVSVSDGQVIMHGYRGADTDTDMEQEPDIAYLGERQR